MWVSPWVLPLQIDAWAQSNSIPGQFTGSTGAQILSSDELTNSGPQAWIRKVEVTQALLAQQHTPQHSRIAKCVAQHVPSAAGWAQGLPWLSLRCDSLPLSLPGHCCAARGRALTASLAHSRQGLVLLLSKSLVFGICFMSQVPNCPCVWFSVVAPLPLSGSPGFCGRCGGLKQELQLKLLSVMFLDPVQ